MTRGPRRGVAMVQRLPVAAAPPPRRRPRQSRLGAVGPVGERRPPGSRLGAQDLAPFDRGDHVPRRTPRLEEPGKDGGIVRVSVGCEDLDDLVEDFERGLSFVA